jgi:hypothetical protein
MEINLVSYFFTQNYKVSNILILKNTLLYQILKLFLNVNRNITVENINRPI